jgi:amidase
MPRAIPGAATDPITDLSADALSSAIRSRQLSCREVMRAYLDRITQRNPRYNAIVNLAPEEALLAQADARDADLNGQRSAHGWRGWLHGLPQAIKDTGHAQGFPTTFGSVLLKDALPANDSLITERMKAAGCVVIGKSNMPELGLGSHTFNDLFGATPNAWDASVSAGGSSGGAAVALALRLLPVADGSDFMGSLRNPAAWNHVWGLRPSQGRVPLWPTPDVWVNQLGTEGPMARNVPDLTRLLEIQAGPDARAPLALGNPLGTIELPTDTAPLRGLRVGWLGDLQGHLAMEPGLLPVLEQGLAVMAGEGAIVEPLAPQFDPAAVWQAWLVWRRALSAGRVAALIHLPGARQAIKPEAMWEYEQAQSLSFAQFMQASVQRTQFHAQMLAHFERADVLALPTTQCWPFPLQERWPNVVGGRSMDTYHRWMECTLYATFAGLPALSMPAGFHANGRWPVGLQLIGKPQGDAALLRVAAAYENACGAWLQRRPEA